MSAYELPRSSAATVSSRAGRIYRVFVAWPDQPAPRAGFPVVYVLDANAIFATVVEAIRMRAHRPASTGVRPAVIVGIGYEGDGPFARGLRLADYVPAAIDPSGDAGGFLAAIDQDIRPRIERAHPIDRSRQTLLGHSLAGLFVLHTLVSEPEMFGSYIAVSPSIWMAPRYLRDASAMVTPRLEQLRPRRRVLIAVGEYEQSLAPWQAGTAEAGEMAARRLDRRMVDRAREFASHLNRTGSGAAADCRVFDGEDHASVVMRAISHGLRFATAEGALSE